MNVENFLYERMGIRKEHPQTKLWAAAIMIGLSNRYARRSDLVVNGSVAQDGAGLLIGNHVESADFFRVIYTGVHNCIDDEGRLGNGRLIRSVAKSTLFGIPESPEVRARTGKKDILNSDNPFINFLIKMTAGAVLDGTGAISIRRGEVDRLALRRINEGLYNKHLIAFSVMESRMKTGEISGIGQGTAFVVKRNPDVPFYLAGVSKEPNVVNIAKPSTYREIQEKMGELTLEELALFLADGIVKLLPPKIQEAWKVQRVIEQARLDR